MTSIITPLLIEKEEIASLHFPEAEVLHSPEEIKERLANIESAMKLGNNYKNKVTVVFEDDTNLKKVETTVWGMTDKRIILKGGTVIPFHRVHKVII